MVPSHSKRDGILGLLLGIAAPVLTPKGKDFPFLFSSFLSDGSPNHLAGHAGRASHDRLDRQGVLRPVP